VSAGPEATRASAIAIRLLCSLARHMSVRMRDTNEILRRLDDSRG